jgi:hypothetical protein
MYGMAADHMNLQTTLAATNPPTDKSPTPHHPLSCRSELLWLDEDGTFGCEHVQVPPDDPRTRGAIDQSVAILLLELAVEKERP